MMPTIDEVITQASMPEFGVADVEIHEKAAEAAKNHNYFPTPKALAYAVMLQFFEDFAGDLPHREQLRVLDAGYGAGNWGKAFRLTNHLARAAHLHGVELRTVSHPVEYDTVRQYDFAAGTRDQDFHIAIGNPPYGRGLMDPFILENVKSVVDGGFVLQLLRYPSIGGQNRNKDNGLWALHPWIAMYQIMERPSFTGDGVTEINMEYAVMIIKKGWRPPSTGLRVVRQIWWEKYEGLFEGDVSAK